LEKAEAISPVTVVVTVVVTAPEGAGGITIGATPMPTTAPMISPTINATAVVVFAIFPQFGRPLFFIKAFPATVQANQIYGSILLGPHRLV
jgi:hypothetical protein